MALDSLRAAIINEVEESVNQAQDQNKLSIRMEALSSWAAGNEDNFQVNDEALAQCKRYGLDARYSYAKATYNSCTEQKNVQSKAPDDSMLEERLESFLARYADAPAADDGADALTAKERVLSLKLGLKAFDPLLVYVKETRPTFFRALQQHPLITGKTSFGKKKHPRRGNKREKREEKESKEGREGKARPPPVPMTWATSSAGDRVDVSEDHQSWEHRRHVLAVVVAKAVASGSMQSILIAVSLLFQILHDEQDQASLRLIPVGDILCAIFEKKAAAEKSSRSFVSVPNPFRRCVMLDGKGSDMPKGRTMSDSVSRLGDVCSQGTAEEQPGGPAQEHKPPSLSGDDTRFFFGVHSDAGSTVGSTVGSLMAEQGTETASVGGGDMPLEHLDIICEDATEDELLAQALALSLSGAIPGANISQTVSFNVGDRSVDSPTPSEYTARDSTTTRQAGGVVNFEKLAEVYPMSSFGPFCSEDFWSHSTITASSPIASLEPTKLADISSTTSLVDVPIENVIIALVTYLRGGLDVLFNEQSAPWIEDDLKSVNKGCKSDLLVATSLELVPMHATHFSLLENLLDLSLHAIKRISETAPVKDTDPSVIRNNQERVELEIATRKWNFEKYFSVWTAISLLNILRANFKMLLMSGTAPNSVGLDRRRPSTFGLVGEQPRGSGAGGVAQYQPLVCNILKLLVESIGGNHLPNGCASGRVDTALGDSASLTAPRHPTNGDDEDHLNESSAALRPQWVACDSEYRNCLVLSGIDAFTQGFPALFTSAADRENVFYSIMYNSPVPGNNNVGLYLFDSPCFTLKRYCNSIPVGNLSELLPLYYRSVLLQKLCLSIAATRMKPFFIYGSDNDGSFAVTSATTANAGSLFDSNMAAPTEDSRASYIGFWPSTFERCDSKADIRGSPSETTGDYDTATDGLTHLYSCLLCRLGRPSLMKDVCRRFSSECMQSAEKNDDYFYGPSCSMFWGELGLLETIQKCFVEQLYNPPPKHDKTGALAFDTARCSSNISVSSSECSITQQKNKDWSTATVAKGFPPGSGVHRWSVHMEKCSKGNVFIGVVTSDASIDSYIGSDRHGWGFIGTPSLWHDHGKVTSDYGVKIAAGSVVHVTLDTDKKTLSYVISGTDWGVAFENLPDKILYPAVSLYQLGDSVSITSRSGHNNCSRPSTGSRTAGSDGETVEDIKIITKYFLSFFSEVDEILQCILKAEYSDEQRRHMLNHPFMVSLFPQLSASFASAKAGNRFISVRILPYLTFLTRMIAAVHEKFPAIGLSSHCDNRVPNCLVDDVCGEWKLESSAAGSIPAQTYYVSMTTCGCRVGEGATAPDDMDACDVMSTAESQSQSPRSRSSVRPIHFTGIGSSGVFSLKVVGTILGSRLQFHETWVDNDTCSVNARISLDGASFAGEYTTANNNGTIVGTRLFDRLSHYKNYCTSNSLLKAAMIGVMACGSLSCNLIHGVDPKLKSGQSAALGSSSKSSLSKTPDSGSEVVSTVEAFPENADDMDQLDDEIYSADDDDNDDDEEADFKNENDVSRRDRTWEDPMSESSHGSGSRTHFAVSETAAQSVLLSSLVSGGLHVDKSLVDILKESLFSSFQEFSDIERVPVRKKVRVECSSSRGDDGSRAKLIHDAWVSKVFSCIANDSISFNNESGNKHDDSELIVGVSASIPAFCQQLMDAKPTATITGSSGPSSALKLDQYIIHHTGMAALSRIGGDVLQNARRTVLAALVKHCGCATYCERIAAGITSGKLSSEDRPNSLLIQIWTSGQRVIEQSIRKKQLSGVSYSFLGQELCSKAMILFDIQPQTSTLEISEILSLSSFDGSTQNVYSSVQDTFAKILLDAVEFLQANITDLRHLKSALVKATVRGLYRTAGFRSLSLMLGKTEDRHSSSCEIAAPVISSTVLQETALQYVVVGIHASTDMTVLRNSLHCSISRKPTGIIPPSPAFTISSTQASHSIGARSNATSEDGNFGYYGEGLTGCSFEIFQELRSSIESLYDFITRFLERCTWGSDKKGQCTALACWNIHVKPEDHQFLNRCGVFKVLQSVLNDCRSASEDNAEGEESYVDKRELSEEENEVCHSHVIGARTSALERLSRLAMLTVHSLAAQVAFSKDIGRSVQSLGAPLQRQPSGPETLSRALFDMLFSELFFSFRQLISKTKENAKKILNAYDWTRRNEAQQLFSSISQLDGKTSSETNGQDAAMSAEFSLQGEEYIYRILRLLYGVSESEVCRRYLSSAKWMTLLFSGIGYGGIGVQRRLMRLLRRLLSTTDMSNMDCFVPKLFIFGENDLMDQPSPFDDDDSRMLLANDCNTEVSPSLSAQGSKRIVEMLLDAATAVIPTVDVASRNHVVTESAEIAFGMADDDMETVDREDESSSGDFDFSGLMHIFGTHSLISAESVSILRLLLSHASWKDLTINVLEEPLRAWKASLERERVAGDELPREHGSLLPVDRILMRKISAVLGVTGGYPDRVREGGIVALKPMSLISNSGVESVALKLTALSHICGLVVDRGKLGGVDVLLVEPAGSRNIRPLSSSLQRDTDDAGVAPQGFVFSGSSPLKPIRVAGGDVTPISEILLNLDSLRYSFVESLLYFVSTKCLPEIISGIKSDDSSPQRFDNENEMMGVFVKTTSLRALSKCTESSNVVDAIIKSSPDHFLKILSLSMTESLSGGLVVLEKIEEKWCNLWDMLVANKFKRESPGVVDDPTPTVVYERKTTSNNPSPRLQRPDDASDRNRESHGDESPFGSSIGLSLLAGMRFGQQSQSPSDRSEAVLSGLFGLGGRSRASPPPQSPFGSSLTAISESAKRTMMEMGFRPEWCEAALRRSRNNVEIAINLCFEHGDDMDRLVQEDVTQQQQAAANRANSSAGSRALRGPPRSSAYIPGLSRRSSDQASSAQRESEEVVVDQEAVQHMSNLGFPASWCVRALAASSNDPDAALNWILSHADDLLVEYPGAAGVFRGGSSLEDRLATRQLRRGRPLRSGSALENMSRFHSGAGSARYEPSVDSGAVEANSSDDEDEETGSSTFGSSPLSLISGQGTFSDNLVCSANGEGSFPTIGCRGYAVESGKWYFEAQILTSGCIQIGWVDCGYIGMSENGQGVGDCLNSWCFDGWRVMLWHELSAEWGARWAPGNTVGCAVDMDERKMIFSLNGETESIGMGEAFQGFRCHGGLYPACSISQGQKIKYRFGPTGFKYPPPEGYRPYAEHIIHVNESKVATTPPNAARKSLSSTQMSANCENTIEEQQGESECDWHRRYFSVDDNQGLSLGGARSMQFPEPSFSRTVPGSLVEATKQFKALSMDLSILYARLTVLNVLKSSSSLHSFENFVKLLTTSALNDCGYTSLEAVIKLIRLSSITSNRSRVHLQTVSLMPRPTIDNNLGSIFSIGGFPAVGGLYGSLSSMLAKARSTGDCSMASTMLQQLRSELVRSTQRDHCSGWKLGTGLIPSVAKSGQLPDSLGSTLPSLNLAVGLTIVLISQLSSEIQAIVEVIPDKNSNFRNEESIFVRWAEEMCGHWCIGLQSPNIVVKLCCIRMLNALFQEFLISSSKHSVFFQSGFMCKLCNIIPLKRLEQFALNRIKHERGVSPVCSEFLQALLEFVNSVSIARTQILVNTGHATGEFLQEGMVEEKGHLNPYLDQSSIETGDDNMKFNWDAIEGSLVSDDSWDVWTGSIRHLPAELPSQHASCSSQNRSMRDRPQNQPPELLVGCKVARKKRVMSGDLVRPPTPPPAALDAQSQDDARDEEIPVRQADLQGLMDSNVVLSNDSDDEPRNSVGGVRNTLSNIRQRIAELESRQRASPLAEASEASHAPSSWARGFLSRPSGEQESAKNSTPSAPAVEFEWEIGTVVGIASHSDEGSLPGSARIIRWDSPGRMKKETVQRELSVTNEEIGSSDDGSDLETVSWGHNNVFDVVHVSLNRDGSINQQYPPPKTRFIRAVENGFGGDTTFGVILRLRSARKLPTDKEEGIADRFDGVLEFCDFGSTIYVTGTKWDDGAWAITEERLLIGSSHASWSVRFGQAHWKPGTTYDLAVANRSSVYNDKYNQALVGQFSIPVNVGPTAGKSFSVSGDIYLQKNNLFHFDENLRANAISLSLDKLSAFSDGKESRSTVFGNIGFTEGVHYWELKIEQGDIGNIFVGVAEKTWMPGQPSNLRLNRWLGSGFVNIRTSFKHTPSGTAERVYGDHFHTGDTVGVLLDMDRGRLSFFLDGLKYGEHSLTDLGEAFDGLTSTTTLRKALYPVVGMRRNLDRVTITPRWLSCYGPDANGILRTVRRSSSLLSSWNFERPATKPLARDMWIYREAWREHYRWNYRPIDRVRTRCKSPLLYVGVDVDPTACVEASIRLGLPMALFRGDRVTFTRSGGRLLEGGEEAVILGAYRGLLWYRLDTQHGGESRAITGGGDSSTPFVLEGASLAWQLCAQDVDGLVLCRRAGHVDPRIAALKLPRIPEYKGARLNVQFSSGAIMRDGIEIDTSEVVGTVDVDATVTAFERRKNSSNILRYRVVYNGKVGWISDRIRGGSEEHMVYEVTQEPPAVVETAMIEARQVLKSHRISTGGLEEDASESPWVDVSTLEEAKDYWQSKVIEAAGTDMAAVFLRKTTPIADACTLESFIELAATFDGSTQWSVEADMQLSELISRIASKEGVSPLNVSAARVKEVCRGLDPTNVATSHLVHLDANRVIARAAVLRVANIVFGYSLPYIDVGCPEEKLQVDMHGRLGDVQVATTSIPTSGDMTRDEAEKESSAGGKPNDILSWQPPCDARKLRSLRRLMFSQTKSTFFESVLDMTMTPTPLPQDEYEEPREIKTIKVNRVMATTAKLSVIKNNSERLKVSVFGQLYKEMRGWPTSAYRRSYVGKGHGGQKRAFKVKFMGEGVNDYGGPYRAVFEQVVDEMQCDAGPVAGQKAWEKTLLTLLVPCPNRASAAGSNQDKFMFVPSNPSPPQQELMQFLGRLTGMAVRHNLNLGLDFSSLVWRPLVRLPVGRGHLNTVDSLAVSRLEKMEKLGIFLEKRMLTDSGKLVVPEDVMIDADEANDFDVLELPQVLDASFSPPDWADLTFSVYLSDGYTRVSLVEGGEQISVNVGNWREYIRLVEETRLREGSLMLKLFSDGLAAVLPVQLLPLFTGPELELMISGTRSVDVDLLQKCTEYENLQPDSELVRNFWSVLKEMDDDEKTLFLRFVWARSRMPATAQDFPMNFKLQAASTGDDFLPHAQTCFFSLALPAYGSKEALKEKLLYAINNSPNMDADVRLHNAEGWADS